VGDHSRQNVVATVHPQTGEFLSLIVDLADTNVFQFFLDQLAETVPKEESARQLLTVDNASWHKAGRLNWHQFEPAYLPAYQLGFNPIERLWLRLEADWFWDFIAGTHTELTDPLCTGLKSFVDRPAKPPLSALSGR
jgi:hypothetical protein